MSREVQIPLALWITAAIVAHMAGGGGAAEVAKTIEDRAQIRRMVLAVQEELRPSNISFDVISLDETAMPSTPVDPPENKKNEEDTALDDTADPDDEVAEQQPKPPKKKPKPPKVEPEKKAELAPPPPTATAAVPPPPIDEKKEVALPPVTPPPPLPPVDNRIAIQQHVQKDQPDNPNANRIADDANTVAEETMARIRSYDQNDPNPTPGSPSGPKGPLDQVGDSDHDKAAHSEDKVGDPLHAPGEGKDDSTSAEHHNPAQPSPQESPLPSVSKGAPPGAPKSVAGGTQGGATPRAEVQAQKGSTGGTGPASPEVVNNASGGWSMNPANPGGDGKSRVAGKQKKARAYQSPVRVGSLGLGAPALPNGPNINLTMAGVEAAVGHEKLKAERAADGASRKSAHRGSWETNKWEKWRAAIENYDPSVKPGNQTALNAARVPFASYINSIHNRLHPIFADEFLAALDNLPPSHAFNQNLVTHLEIVLNKDNGRIVRMGVTKTSGMTAFDIVALNSVNRASPFGKAPDAIVSPDGNIYLHWEFHRDPFDACTTRNAHPFLLREAPKVPVTPVLPGKASPTRPSDEQVAPSGPLLPLR